MVIADFQIEYKVGRFRFFQKIFLVTNTKFEIILRIFFLKLSNINMLFDEKTLIQKIYITNKVLPTIKQIQVINKKNFVIVTLDINNKIFVIYVAI